MNQESLDSFTSQASIRTEPYNDIEFIVVEDKKERRYFRELIDIHHQYKDFKHYPGRRIRWLIRGDGSIIGGIGIASSPMHLGDRDDYIGWTNEQKQDNLNKIANNHRFCLRKRGFGSQILSKFYTVAKEKWKQKYNDNLVLLETLVKPPYEGTVYKASGWDKVGMTKGMKFKRPPSKAMLKKALDGSEGEAHKERAEAYMNKTLDEIKDKYPYMEFKREKSGTPKHIFCKPLHRYWRKELTRCSDS